MTSTVFHTDTGLDVTCVATREPRISILRFHVSAVPDDFDEAMRAVNRFFHAFKGRLVTHVLLDRLETPSLSQITSLLRYVMDLQTVMDEKLKATIIQSGRNVRRVLMTTKTIVDQLYTPLSPERAARRPLEILETDAEMDRVMDGILTHEAKKRTKREARR